jgi:tyrosyl-tRNA synthetase
MEHILKVASTFTVGQFMARDSFRKRSTAGDPIWLHELLYALLQGYDAVALRTDVQLGGTEQLFNLLAGRKLQEAYGQEPQVCITYPILVGTDGHNRMSKSMGNTIGIAEAPEAIYGKVMSIPDQLMLDYFRLVTRWTPDQVAQIEADLVAGRVHPMEAKKRLAWEIVDCYHGSQAANAAAGRFERVHQKRELPKDMPEMVLGEPMTIPELMVVAGLCQSKSDGRRLVDQGGVRIDGEPVESVDQIVTPGERVLQVGKRRFLRLVPPT